MTIPLPPLPDPDCPGVHFDGYSTFAVHDIQNEAMRAALQAAAQVCRDFHATDSLSNYGLVLARMIDELAVEC